MKFKNILIVTISTFMLIFYGCEETVLNKESLSTFVDDDIWGDVDQVERYVFSNYHYMGHWYNEGLNWKLGDQVLGLMTVCDEGYMNWDRGAWLHNFGTLTASDMGLLLNRWGWNWEGIQNCNMFFDRIGDVSGDQEKIERLTGEMKFIRAKLYANLIHFFGGVPIKTNAWLLDDDFTVERNSYQECVDFIISELNSAANMVPVSVGSGELGRITKGACLALKSEVLLYAASKLHEPDTEPSGPLYDYNNPNKWQEASDAAKAVIDLGQYSLMEVNEWKDYNQIFLHTNPEIIFARLYHEEYGGIRIDKVNTPNGYNGYTGNLPLQNLVDAFEMKNGMKIDDPGSGYDPDSMYKDRDPRFYASIVYNGCMLRGRKVEFFLPGGKDSRDGPSPWNYAETGYGLRKFLDESYDFDSKRGEQPYIFWRLAEIYLNYAEAQYHLGKEDVAREYVNKIRARVSMPEINSSGQELLNDIMHERRIELCFEDNRYYDVRRWMVAEETENIVAGGIAWEKVDEAGNRSFDGKLQYKFITVQERSFNPRQYYLPIPLAEIQRATGMVQNNGY